MAALQLAACQPLEFVDAAPESGGGGIGGDFGATTGTGESPGAGGGALVNEQADGLPPVAYTEAAPDAGLFDFLDGCVDPAGLLVPQFTIALPLPDGRSTASATWAQAMLAVGRVPDAAQLRLDEFRNHFGLPPTNLTTPLTLEFPPTDGLVPGPQELVVRFAPPLDVREPLRLVLLVDTSTSMHAARVALRVAAQTVAVELSSSPTAAVDRLGVVRFASDVQIVSPLSAPSVDAASAIASESFDEGAGASLHDALSTAFGLGTATEPVHVLLLSDGGFAVDEALTELVSSRRVEGHTLSVLLLGKSERAGDGSQNPLSFARAEAEALSVPGGGALLYAADDAQASALLADGGVFRRLAVGGRSPGLSLSLPAFLEVNAPMADTSLPPVERPYAPGVTHSLRVTALPCAPDLLKESWFMQAGLLSKLSLAGAAEPFDTQVLFSSSAFPETRLDHAIVRVVQALRQPSDAAAREAARAELGDAQAGAGCGAQSDAVICARLAALDAMVDELGAIVGD